MLKPEGRDRTKRAEGEFYAEKATKNASQKRGSTVDGTAHVRSSGNNPARCQHKSGEDGFGLETAKSPREAGAGTADVLKSTGQLPAPPEFVPIPPAVPAFRRFCS